MGDSKYRSWLVLGAATIINLIIGIFYIWSVISKALINDLGWTSKQASLPFTVVLVLFVVFMVIFGRLQDIRGPRLTGTLSGFLLGGGLILSSIFLSPVGLVITFGVIASSGIGIAYVSTSPPAVKWFPPEKKGMITGITVAGVGISAVVFAPLTNYLIQTVGIEKTFLYLGIIALVVMVTSAQVLTNPPPGYIPEKTNKTKANNKKLAETSFAKDVDWKGVLKDFRFYKLWLMFAFSSTAGLMITAHAAKIVEVQVGWESGFYLVIILSVFNASGRFLGGVVSDKIGRLRLMRIIFIFQAINMLFFGLYSNIYMLTMGISIVGLCYGAGYSVFPAAVIDLFGIKNFGFNFGMIMTGCGFGGIIGPMIAAAFFDATKSYVPAYYVAGVLLLLVFLFSFTFDRGAGKWK